MTYQDVTCERDGKPLPLYDIFLLYNEEELDVAADLTAQLEGKVRVYSSVPGFYLSILLGL